MYYNKELAAAGVVDAEDAHDRVDNDEGEAVLNVIVKDCFISALVSVVSLSLPVAAT